MAGPVRRAGKLNWSLAGNTTGFGQVWDGRPFWTGDFTGDGKTDILFYFPGDGNWWLGRFDPNGGLSWNHAGNTGRPHRSRVRIHFKLLVQPTGFTLNEAMDSIREVYSSVGILAEQASVENLNLADTDIDAGSCTRGNTTQEQRNLFNNRNNVGADEVAVYIARTVTNSSGGALNGCAANDGRASCIVARTATRWTTAHEVGHVLGLNHVSDTNRLMFGSADRTNLPPDLVESERQTMESSAQTIPCR